MAERVPLPAFVLPVPDGVSDPVAAALGNAGLAAWMPLSDSGRLAAGETVLDATSARRLGSAQA
jgi:NADPH:quinone reductase-like Zn-dependent oxidoreductase